MSDIAIKCEGLSKQYRIGERESYKALRDVLTDAATVPFRRLAGAFRNGPSNGDGSEIRNPNSEVRNSHFWALDDVSFEVKRGEVVGIIGRNGAGKSTLLKILARITRPTRGTAEIHGRVGSLLEVGTGFHPELPGRENVYLNGAILGMRKAEIERKFDEIIAFAEVERFIDTPVKRYSSGMHVRLAFAVAAHLEPEILLVDEVLAVGDAGFQKKCLGKIGDVVSEGRSVLFVSHNMAAVQALCSRALLISIGTLVKDGTSREIVSSYLSGEMPCNDSATTNLVSHPNRERGRIAVFSSVTVRDGNGRPASAFFPGDDLVVEIELQPGFPINRPSLGIGFDNSIGVRVFSVLTDFTVSNWERVDRLTRVTCTIPAISLTPDRYSISLSVGDVYEHLIDNIPHAASFVIELNDYFGSGRMPTADLGVVLAQSKWEFSDNSQTPRAGVESVT